MRPSFRGSSVTSLRSACIVFAAVAAALCAGPSAAQVAPAAPAAPEAPAATPTAGDENPKPRVIVRVSRNREVPGYLALEEDDVIVVRTLTGVIESFPVARILEVVRLVDPAPGQHGVVYLRDGQEQRGVIIEDGFDQVVLEIEGIRTALRRPQVDRVVLEPTFQERYDRYKASIPAKALKQHLELCRWLIRERRWELAQRELKELLAAQPDPEAQHLLVVVEAQLALKPAPTPPAPDGVPAPGDELVDERLLVTRDDVNLIRVYEIDFERPPRLAVSTDTIKALIEKYGASSLVPSTKDGRDALFRAEPIDIVRLMFELRSRDLYPQVQVLSEPYSLNLFRRRVHDTWLINNCATSRCHGGEEAGRLFLYRRNAKDDRVRYTNLLILERLSLDPEWPLINYEDPARSLIIQYGLPREAARKPHPDVPGWKPAFARPQLSADTVSWIQAMMKPRPEYPVAFTPPLVEPAAPLPPPPPPSPESPKPPPAEERP